MSEAVEESYFDAIVSSFLWAVVIVAIFTFVKRILTPTPPPAKPSTPIIKVPKQDMSLETLLEYDGSHGKGICVAIKGDIFDVSSRPGFYGPKGGYAIFAGHDATRALAKMSLTQEDVENSDVSDLSTDEIETMEEWYESYKAKYPLVGKVIPSSADK
mmetsp:Transcript_33910/g.95414  ORF Transcript_33910/g.95414 Transcript_33910/m.95414 type:complete len:158 (+) Transcript_33910:109-582(+)|eukprot:CAMPEP_0119131746 /NCGR_PEP_ID=MMETSP1310-20130426/10553_1 /TAXON_ID=464262 /ORGANISM="Genus nov. species nov., Strain RCC2339" /LENGTH=157 /DNA_ID=CAMNT_0007122339 /DNA_START=177 /DNA_END=650 /DNA_ORIENTATION=-